MSKELTDVIEKLGSSFDLFKAENDTRLKAIESHGTADVVLTEKVDKINADITEL